MSCGCLHLGSTMRTTPRISTSARAAFVCAGKRATPIRSVRCAAPHGTRHATRSKASSCMSRCPRRGLNDGARQLVLSPPAFGATPSACADLGAFFPASHALAADGLDEGVEIIAAIVVRDLVPRLDVLDGADLDHVLDKINFGIRPARMIDIACPVPAARAIDRPTAVDLEHVAIIELVGGFGTQLPAAVANDELPFLDCDAGEEAEPGF